MRFPFGLSALALVLGGASASGGGKVVRIEKPQRTRVYVPSGTFAMGITEDEAQQVLGECESLIQLPQFNGVNGVDSFCGLLQKQFEHMKPRDVYLDAFYVDRDEVTAGAYRACVAAGACTLDALIAGDERYIGGDTIPMVNVTWDESRTFCSWRGGRLPTEAEWEHAARANERHAWPWGDASRPNEFNHGRARSRVMQAIDRQVQQNAIQLLLGEPDLEDGFELIAPTGSFPWGEGPYGTRDQAGNVAEWTADAWLHSDRDLGYESKDHDVWVALPAVNPRRDGPATEKRVVRGGSWRQPSFIARTNVRDPFNWLYEPNARFSHVGFRCAYNAR